MPYTYTIYDTREAQLKAYKIQLDKEPSPIMREYYIKLIETIQQQQEEQEQTPQTQQDS